MTFHVTTVLTFIILGHDCVTKSQQFEECVGVRVTFLYLGTTYINDKQHYYYQLIPLTTDSDRRTRNLAQSTDSQRSQPSWSAEKRNYLILLCSFKKSMKQSSIMRGRTIIYKILGEIDSSVCRHFIRYGFSFDCEL